MTWPSGPGGGSVEEAGENRLLERGRRPARRDGAGGRAATSRSSAIAPSSISTMRSASATASATSWVTRIAVKPSRRHTAFEQRLHLDAGQRVERAERLVEREKARAADERARERDALLLPAREHRRAIRRRGRRGRRPRALRARRSRAPGSSRRRRVRLRHWRARSPRAAAAAPGTSRAPRPRPRCGRPPSATRARVGRVEAGDAAAAACSCRSRCARRWRRTGRRGRARSRPRSTRLSPKLLASPRASTGAPARGLPRD